MYELNQFLSFVFDWVNSFKFDDTPGHFMVKKGKEKPSLYGVCDMIYVLAGVNKLDEYFNIHTNENRDSWISVIQSYQNPKNGWFKEGLINFAGHFKEHCTAFAVSALNILGGKPKYPLAIAKKLNTEEKVEKWLKKGPEWGLLYWPGSHRGGGIGSIFATLGPDNYPHEKFFEWYFNWLDKHADPVVGYWRLGRIHKLKKNRLTKNELGGAVHYYWVYEFMKHKWPYPERIIDSTLLLQNNIGTWDNEYSYCIDLDAIHAITRCTNQTKGYREPDVIACLEKYLNYAIPKINDRNFIFENYITAHKLTGYVSAVAEIYKFKPEWFKIQKPLIQTLDKNPWI